MEYTIQDIEEERLKRVIAINLTSADRAELQRRHGKVWNTQELGDDFEVVGFAAPFVVVKSRIDGEVGSLTFQHNPRFYFHYIKDEARG